MSNKGLLHDIVKDVIRIARELGSIPTEEEYLSNGVFSKETIGDWEKVIRATGLKTIEQGEYKQPKILIFDIETAPLLGYVWALFDQNIGLNQIEKDWYVLSWSAKWLHDPPEKIMYMDQRKQKNIENDKKILQGIWSLLDEADIVITQNGKRFDHKKLNARFLYHKLQPPSSYRHIDILIIAKRHFGFTSHKLEYMTNHLNSKYKKLKHEKFSGFELWRECMNGNIEAWEEMEKYNKYDVLALEELYYNIIPWDNSIDYNMYHDSFQTVCTCGSKDIKRNGYFYSSTGRYQRYKCTQCGSELRDKENLLSKQKKSFLKSKTTR